MRRWPLRRRTALLSWLPYLLVALAALMLYRPCLGLPFFWDDAANFNWMYERPLASIWLDATGFPYYRPLVFSLWRALQIAFGPTGPLPFQLANLTAHLGSALLAGRLARRFIPGSSPGVRTAISASAAALVAFFPFAALAVCHTAQGFHLFVTLLALASVEAALRWRETDRTHFAAVALALAVLAPFAHESGIVTSGLILLALMAIRIEPETNERPFPARMALAAIVSAANLAFLAWWVAVPKTRPETFTWVGWESILQSAVFFIEGLTFPLQFPARWLMAGPGWSDMAAVTVLGLLALGLCAFLLQALPEAPRIFAFSTSYWLLATLPSVFALPFSYIIVSPRLQVFPGPAAAVLWALTFCALAARLGRSRPRLRGPFLAVLTALAVLPPALHIARTARLHEYGLSPIRDLSRAVRATPSAPQLVLNAPNWVAPVRASYALGHEGVEIMPSYITPQLLVWTNTGLRAPLDGLAFPNVFPRLETIYFDAWGEAQDWHSLAARLPYYERVWLWEYADESARLREAGVVALGAPRPPTYLARFADRVWLLEARAELDPSEARLQLVWWAAGEAQADIFAHVLDCEGQLLGQRDGAALGGVYPLWLWPAGASVRDVRHVPLARAPLDGCFRVMLGLFDPPGGARLPAYDPRGARLPDDALMLEP